MYLYRFLRWTERYTKTDMVYLGSAAGWMAISRGLGSILSLCLTFFLAALLTKEDFGSYRFVLSAFAIVTAFSLTGMNTAASQSVARGKEGVIRDGFYIGLRWSIPMTVLSFSTSAYYLLNGELYLSIAMVLIGVTAPFIQNANIYDALFVGRRDFRSQTVFAFLSTLFPVVSTLLIAYVTRDALWVTVAYLTTSALTTLGLYGFALLYFAPNNDSEAAGIRYGKHLSLMGVLGALSLQLDRILVFSMLGAASLATYALALAAPQQVRFGSKVIATAALPKFSGGNLREIRSTLHRKAFVILVCSIVLVAGYVVAAPHFFRIFFPEYMDAIPYSQLFALTILFFPSALYQQFLTSLMNAKRLYALQVSTPIVKISLLFLLIPTYGMLGAIIAILAMEIYRLLFVLFLIYQIPDAQLPEGSRV